MKEQKRELGFRLREAITQKGYTAEQFSEATGIPYETVQNYLKEKNFPSFERTVQMEKVLGISFTDLLEQ